MAMETVVIVGDSMIREVARMTSFHRCTVIVAPGCRTYDEDSEKWQDRLWAPLHARLTDEALAPVELMLVHLGVNSLRPNTGLSSYMTDVRMFVDVVRYVKPGIKFLWSTVLPRPNESVSIIGERMDFNMGLRHLPQSLEDFIILETVSDILPLVDNPKCWRDHIHLSKKGARVLARSFMEGLRAVTADRTGWEHLRFHSDEEDASDTSDVETEKRTVVFHSPPATPQTPVVPPKKANPQTPLIPPSKANAARDPTRAAMCTIDGCKTDLTGRTLQYHFVSHHLPSCITYGRVDAETMNNWGKLFNRIMDKLGLDDIHELLDFVLSNGWFPINRKEENVQLTGRHQRLITAFHQYLGLPGTPSFHETQPKSPAVLISWRILLCLFSFGFTRDTLRTLCSFKRAGATTKYDLVDRKRARKEDK